MERIIYKRIVMMLMMMLGLLEIQAQPSKGFRFKVGLQTNFNSGVHDIRSFTNGPNADYVVSFLPSMGASIAFEWSFDRVYVGLSHLTNYGVSLFDVECFNQKIDQVGSLNMGFKLWRSDVLALDGMIGVGFGLTRFLFVNSQRSAYIESLTSGTLVMPFAVIMWFGNTLREHSRVGLTFEYMLPIAPLGKVVRTGFDGSYSRIDITPSTLSVGVKYQF